MDYGVNISVPAAIKDEQDEKENHIVGWVIFWQHICTSLACTFPASVLVTV